MKRLTVIIPGYNTPKEWWLRCVDSVLRATGPDDEILVVDDGSAKDFSVEGSWWSDARIRVLHKANGGLADARNFALAQAQGAYVTFVDSDDEIVGDVFEKCTGLLRETGSDIVLYGVKVVWVSEGLCKSDVLPSANWGRLGSDALNELLSARLFNYACNKIYARAFLDGCNEWGKAIRFDLEGMPCEDSMFNLSCLMAGARFCNVNQVGYVYYRTGGTLLSTYKKTGLAGLRKNSDLWRRYCRDFSVSESRFKGWAIMDERQLLMAEWGNIWFRKSPYSLAQRYNWLLNHKCIATGSTLACFLKMLVTSFARQHLYFLPIRRRILRRTFGRGIEPWRRNT